MGCENTGIDCYKQIAEWSDKNESK
jgi:hypothetical protein